MKKKIVLVAALKWGLGRAARCIPVIRAFEKHGCEVAIASDGASLFLSHSRVLEVLEVVRTI